MAKSQEGRKKESKGKAPAVKDIKKRRELKKAKKAGK
jgi:hypothetical protein